MTELNEPSIAAMHASLESMRSELDRLASAIERLARLEERNHAMASLLAELKSSCTLLDGRIKALETVAPSARHTSDLMERVIWAALGLLAAILLKKLGVI